MSSAVSNECVIREAQPLRLWQNAHVTQFALLMFHFPTEGLRAWRLGLRLDREFAAQCLERIELVADLQERHPDLQELRFSLGDDWDQRVRVLAVLQSDVNPEVFDQELEALDEAVIVDGIPTFAKDVTDVDEQFVALGVSQHGVWVEYAEEAGEPLQTAEFVTKAQLQDIVGTPTK